MYHRPCYFLMKCDLLDVMGLHLKWFAVFTWFARAVSSSSLKKKHHDVSIISATSSSFYWFSGKHEVTVKWPNELWWKMRKWRLSVRNIPHQKTDVHQRHVETGRPTWIKMDVFSDWSTGWEWLWVVLLHWVVDLWLLSTPAGGAEGHCSIQKPFTRGSDLWLHSSSVVTL